MTGPVLLNNVDHADLRVDLTRGAIYGDAVNQVTVLPTEFEALGREYPIVLRQDVRQGWRASGLLGLDPGQNLFLAGDRWDARYIPALMARGPFSIGVPAEAGDGEPMIHVDPGNARLTADGGERVFLDHGGNSPYLDSVARVLQAIYAGNAIAPALYAAWDKHRLIEPVTLDVELVDGQHYNISDCHTVSEQRILELSGEALAELNAYDFLRPAIWQQSSLANIAALIERKMRLDTTHR